jgi:hypothetical protein
MASTPAPDLPGPAPDTPLAAATAAGTITAAPTGSPAPSRRRSDRQRAWMPPLIVFSIVFLVFTLPPYLGFDPARSRIPPRADYPAHYPMLVGHILFGSVALLAGCLQVWPWFRARYRAAHRWAGRLYLFGGVFPAGVMVLAVAPVSSTGFTSAVGNTVLALLWLGTSAAGYRAARRRRFAEHRVWMLRSFALTTSIVLNRIWLVLLIALAPALRGVYHVDEDTLIQAAAAASVWLSWVVNLLFVEWFVLRRRPAPGAA